METLAGVTIAVVILWLLGPGNWISKRKTQDFYRRFPEYDPKNDPFK